MSTATIATPTLTAKRADIFKVPSSLLRANEEDNVRTIYEGISELADSIEENGVKMPLRGYKGKEGDQEVYFITDGFRRSRACKLLLERGVEVFVPLVLESKGYSAEQRIFDMFLMNEGVPLAPLDQAGGIKKLIAYGYTEKEIAVKLAKSEGYIRKLNSLNSAPKKLINLISDGVISATLAMSAIAEDKVEEIIEKSKTTVVLPSDENEEMFQGNDGGYISDPYPSSGTKRITSKDISVNSVKEFKKFARNIDEDLLDEGVLPVFQFASQLVNNELTADEIKEFFK